jgi:hypothetical protein
VSLKHLPFLLLLAPLLAAGGCSQAGAEVFNDFTLEEHDHLIAEAPGCYADCRTLPGNRRTCTIRERDCRPVCQELPECKVDSMRPVKVCVVMKQQR